MGRHYGMDWLRIGAFALLILYHIGMYFVPWDWHVKTAHPFDWLAALMLATNSWRIPLLFAVSGYASAALLEKGSVARFARSRTARLLIPLAFGMAFIIPLQPWVELRFKHGYADSFLTFFWQDYFRFGSLNGIMLPTWQHLWFVMYLWVYTMALALLVAVLPARWRSRITRAAGAALAGPLLLLVPLGALLLHVAVIWPGARETYDLVNDGAAHRVYFAVFLFGVLLRSSEPVWAVIRAWWRVAAGLAVAAYVLVVLIELRWPGSLMPPFGWRVAFGVGRLVQGWCALVALLGVADTFWNHEHRSRPMLTEAVFPFYIVHQTIIVGVAWLLLPLRLPALAELAILLPATVAGCWVFYLIGREVPVLRVLIGLRPMERAA